MSTKDARSSPPIAMRIVRPYGSEAELLDHEAPAFTRTGVVLIGAPSRPNGVVLRFEIALKDGTAVMRGEGRVVGYRPPMANEEGALMLRFTRLDVKSKTLLDKAVALREERRSLAPSPVARAAPMNASPPPPPAAPIEPPPAPLDPPRMQRGTTASPPAAATSIRPPLPSVSPFGAPPPSARMGPASTPAVPIPDDDPDEAQEVSDEDLEVAEAEPTVLDPAVMQVAPVAEAPSHGDAAVDDLLAAPLPKQTEQAPPPQPSPADLPHVHPKPPSQPATPVRAPEHAPAPQIPREKAPPPQRSPEPTRRLDSATRESALDRLRARAKKLAEMPSYFPVGDRSSAPNQPEVTKLSLDPSLTPALGSFVADRDK